MSAEMIFWSPGMTLDQIERMIILKAIQHYRHNKTLTANSLGIAIRTLDNKLSMYEEQDKISKQREENERIRQQEFLSRARGNPPNNLGIPYAPNYGNVHQAAIQNSSNDPSSRVRMESSSVSTQKHSVPMPEQSKVQEVLPSKIAQGGKHKGR